MLGAVYIVHIGGTHRFPLIPDVPCVRRGQLSPISGNQFHIHAGTISLSQRLICMAHQDICKDSREGEEEEEDAICDAARIAPIIQFPLGFLCILGAPSDPPCAQAPWSDVGGLPVAAGRQGIRN